MVASLKRGDSIIGETDGPMRFGRPAIWQVDSVQVVEGKYRVVVSTSNDGVSSTQTVDLSGADTVTLVYLKPAMQTALDAFRMAAAEAGVV